MKDYLEEIYQSIKRNKLRTALTGFAVSWGIFMLIVLLGAGNGLLNSFMEDVTTSNANVIKVYGFYTSKPYKGHPENREIKLKEEDIAFSQETFPEILSDGIALSEQSSRKLIYGKESVSRNMMGVFPLYTKNEKINIIRGRFINDKDIEEHRKALVIDKEVAEILFPRTEALHKFVSVDSLLYQVVGIYKGERNSESGVYVPYTTLKQVYTMNNNVDMMSFNARGLTTQEECEQFDTDYKVGMSHRKEYAPDDSRGIWVYNKFSDYLQQQTGANILTRAIWAIGLLTLLSGIVGVSNIMFITVRERRHEFGIRKALGAKPASILWLIVSESIVITTIFGYIGMFLGILTTEYLNAVAGEQVLDAGAFSFTYFKNPTVSLSIAIQALITLIVAGILAGVFPAWKASKTRPIEALRTK
ncbi:MAG: ABC transporter permease [Phocaeicola sp.]|nr:ABC transporter permease [Phocaeicola sp.]MDY5938318.1 ABC transporter permease [Phocaeicola sp.]